MNGVGVGDGVGIGVGIGEGVGGGGRWWERWRVDGTEGRRDEMSKREERLESEGERERKWEARQWLREYSRLCCASSYTYIYGWWCMVCHDGSNSGIPGLKLASHRGSARKLPVPRLKGFVLAVPLLSRDRGNFSLC